MKKLLLLTLSVFLLSNFTHKLHAQATVDLFCEDFDSDSTQNWGMVPGGFPSTAPLFEATDDVYRDLLPYAATDTVGTTPSPNRSRSFLTTPVINGLSNYTSIGVEFYQIAYIERFDEAYLEVSFDGGNNWIKCGNQVINGRPIYTGSSAMLAGGGFSKISRAIDWRYVPVNDDSYVWTNANARWARETFNLTPLIDRDAQAIQSDSMILRIVLADGNASQIGRVGNHRYYLDNFCVRGSNCELVPPTLTLDPPINYPNRYEDRVYLTGPYIFNGQATDNSTIDTVYIDYKLKRDVANNGTFVTIVDTTIGMDRLPGSYFNGQIPSTGLTYRGNTYDIQIGDSVSWRVVARDASPCRNQAQNPPGPGEYTEFQVRGNLPISCKTQPVYTFPHVQDFNNNNWAVTGNGEFNQIEGWTNVEGDFHDWWVSSDTTPTANTGPNDDIPGGGRYLYVEASGYPDSLAYLVSPCFDLFELDNASVRFYLHQRTTGLDTVWVDVFDPTPRPNFPNGRYITNVIPPVAGNRGDVWTPFEFSLFPFINTVTQVRFRAKPDRLSDLSDIALDSFKIEYSPLCDLRAERVIVGPYAPENEKDTVLMNIQNQGVNPIDSFELGYEIILDNSGTVVANGTHTYNDPSNPIAPGSSLQIKLTDEDYDVPLGAYTIRGWVTRYSCDEVRGNDTTQQRTRGLAYRAAYYHETFDDFNRDTIFTAIADIDTIGNFWELGTPNYDKTNSAFSSMSYNSPYTNANAWDILLNRPYTGDGNTVQLISPFIDFSNAQNPFLSFFNNRDIDLTKAGVYIEYSLDRGLTWDSLSGRGDPQRKKWYNSYLAAPGFGGQPVFAGTTRFMEGNWNNWVETELRLPTNIFAGEPYVMFRFNFYAEDFTDNASEFNSNDGMSIDNFLVYDEKPIDMEPQYINKPSNECYMTSTERFLTVFKNRGQNTINSFDAEYVVRHIQSNTVVTKSETHNVTVAPRDTAYVWSTVNFDMRELGDYEVKVITKLTSDGQPLNDTLVKYVENVDGCSIVLELVTGPFQRPEIVDSSYWRFDYNAGGRTYELEGSYMDLTPNDTNRIDVCFKKDAFVRFSLGDRDTAIFNYSIYAYDGEKDTIIVDQEVGGTDSPIKFFTWICPPEISATPLKIYIDNEVEQTPIAKDYLFEFDLRNNGLDSIRTLDIGMSLDGQTISTRNVLFAPPLEYFERSDRFGFGLQYLSPGMHEVCAWTNAPNGNVDELPGDDTLCRSFAVIDTTVTGSGTRLDTLGQRVPIEANEYCTDFEEGELIPWLALKYPTLSQRDFSFELATPSTTNLSKARSGDRAWVTDADSLYPGYDSSAVISPFLQLQKDSCYQVEFYHNMHTAGQFNDGGQVLMSTDTGITWTVLNNKVDAIGDTAGQYNWYNTLNIIGINNNNVNAGWSGNTRDSSLYREANAVDGWVRSSTFIPAYEDDYMLLLFHFASDGNEESEGWAIDDFCFRTIPAPNCFAVGLNERELDLSKLYLGQSVPNPAVSQVEIPYYLPSNGNVHFEVNNVMGQKVREMSLTKGKGNHIINMDVTDLGAGVYYYWIVFEGQKLSQKMIITK